MRVKAKNLPEGKPTTLIHTNIKAEINVICRWCKQANSEHIIYWPDESPIFWKMFCPTKV